MTKVNKDITDNKEQKIDIESESNDLVAEAQNDGERSSKPEQRNNVNLHKVKVENNVNPLFYEIGPFPRKPPKVWIQYIAEGEQLEYNPYGPKDFVVIVFSLVLIMLICTAGICYASIVVDSVKVYFLDPQVSVLFVIMALAVTIVLSYGFACYEYTRVPPCSYICLLITTLAFGVICAYVTVKYETNAVFLGVVASSAVVLACLGLAACTYLDFSKCKIFPIVVMIALIAASLTVHIYVWLTGIIIQTEPIACLVIGTVVYSNLMAFQLRIVLRGKLVQISEDDYAYGAFCVYTSIIGILLNCLICLRCKDEYD